MSRNFELIDRQTGEVRFAGVEASRANRCPVCGKDSWCLIDKARGLTICPRTVSARKIGEAGYMHDDGSYQGRERAMVAQIAKPKPQPTIDAEAMMREFRVGVGDLLAAEALKLGVSCASLWTLGVGYDRNHRAFAFPMYDHNGHMVGIRLRRSEDGFKWAITGSRNGLFYPPLSHDGPVMLPEGPTDTAAMLTLGFDTIGRPFCRGGIDALCEVFSGLNRPAVVIADQDKAGIEGAEATASALFGIAAWVKVITPPPRIKDSRAWLQAGATHDSVMYRVDNVELWKETRPSSPDGGWGH